MLPTASIVQVRRLRGEKMRPGTSIRPSARSRHAIASTRRSPRSAEWRAPVAAASGTGFGLQMSLREWAIQQGWNNRSVRPSEASGILISALGMLAVHYGYERPWRAS